MSFRNKIRIQGFNFCVFPIFRILKYVFSSKKQNKTKQKS